jgi:BlaI family penicillinase repressor
MSANRPPLSEAELRVMKVLWQHGPGTVRELSALANRRGRRWAYTTVLTLLQRLQAKGYVASDTSSTAHVYRPAATREELIQSQLKTVADQLCGGAPAPLLLSLVQTQLFSVDEIAHFRQLRDEMEAKKRGEGL